MKAIARTTVLALTVGSLLALAGSALAADPWKDNGGKDCDDTAFKNPSGTDIPTLSRCAKVWQAYAKVEQAKGEYRSRVIAAFQRLYSQGSETDAKIAKGALTRLGVHELPARAGDTAAAPATTAAARTEPAKPARKRFSPAEPSKADLKKADRYFKAGFKAYKKKDLKGAQKQYQLMVDAAPGYAKAHYNIACIYALQGDDPKMAEHLQNLADMGANGDAEALKMLKLTRHDTDFAEIRDKSTEFKRITGYARIRIQNAVGDAGEENIENLQGSLKKLGHEVTEVAPTEKPWKNPIVWYAAHSKGTAAIVMEVLTHPRSQAILLEPEQLKGYDIVIAWGDDIKPGEEGKTWVADPADAEKKLDDLARKQDDILREPDKTLNDVNKTLDTPTRVVDKVDRSGEKLERSVDKVEGTVDKVKGLFD